MPHRGGLFLSTPAIFTFLLVSVSLSASAIAAGIATRENRVHDVSRVQRSILRLADKAGTTIHDRHERVGDRVRYTVFDLRRVNRLTLRNCRRGAGIAQSGACGQSRPVRQ